MTEETRESYDSGEIVWVKLGSSWWPGEVKNADELPSEVLDFKKPPLVIVKFFDEDSYEYVKTWVNIYSYNCEKKNEFIKKGMVAFRAKVPHMEKFPKDVLKAEEKVGGNPNILSDPMFLPEKKRNYAAEVFGTPSPKTSTPKNKRRSNSSKSSGKKDAAAHITHRRFLGMDDYRAYICIQYPGKDRVPGDKEDEEVLRINREPEQDFNCHSCSFSTKRLEVMILHTKSHIQGVYLSSAWKNKQSVGRGRRKEKPKKPRGSDVVDSDTSSSDSEPVVPKKRKPKSQGAKKAKVKKTEVEKEAPKKDIRSELLEAWEDSDEEEFDLGLDKTQDSQSTVDPSTQTVDGSVSETILDNSLKISNVPSRSEVQDQMDTIETEAVGNDSNRPELTGKARAKSPPQTIEEALNNVSGELGELNLENELLKPVGEQLSTEKLLSTLEDDSMDADDKAKMDKDTDEGKTEDALQKVDDISKKTAEDATIEKWDVEDDDASKQKMDKDIHEAIKSCFDFDEDDEEDHTIVGKAASGRKIPRVIPKVSRKKSSEADVDKNKPQKDKPEEEEDMDAAFKELMEITAVPDLPDVQNTLKCEQNFHNIKTIKFPDKPEQVGSPPKPERKDSTEIATKLTNPKKRFVKSFEDFELMQNEIRRKEEEQLETSKHDMYDDTVESRETGSLASTNDYLDNYSSQYSPESTIQLSKLKSKIMSKIIEEAKINTESKNRIMSKILDPKPKPVEPERRKSINSVEKAKPEEVFGSHRTPRSKILESYRKDTGKQKTDEKADPVQPEVPKSESTSIKAEETVQDRLRSSRTSKDVVPPKKSKWSRRGSHPKKDKNLFMLQETSPTDPPSVVSKEKSEEPAKIENQTVLEVELLGDTPKTDDTAPDEPKLTSKDDVGPEHEIIEEEIVEITSKDEEPTKQLIEVVPLQVDTKEEASEKLPEDDGLREDGKLSSMETDVTEGKKILQEKEPLKEVTDSSKGGFSELAEDTNLSVVQEVPHAILEAEVPDTEISPSKVQEEEIKMPGIESDALRPKGIPFIEESGVLKHKEVLTDEFGTLKQKDILLTEKSGVLKPKESPLAEEESGILKQKETLTEELGVLNQKETLLTEDLGASKAEFPDTETSPSKVQEEMIKIPVIEGDLLKPKETTFTEESGIVKQKDSFLTEEEPSVSKQNETPLAEESGVLKQKDTLSTEESDILPSKKTPLTEDPDVLKPKEIPLPEEFGMSKTKETSLVEESGTEIKDVPLSNTDESIVPLNETELVDDSGSGSETVSIMDKHITGDSLIQYPVGDSAKPLEETIVTAPKKSMKRKMSEDLFPSPVKVAEDFVPLEKKKKDEDSIKEETKVPSPPMESLEKGKDKVEVTMEVEQDTDLVRTDEIGKEKIEGPQIEETEGTVKNSEKSTTEIKEIVEEGNKLVDEEVADKVEIDTSQEKMDKVESDLMIMETEPMLEEPKVESKKEPNDAKEHVNEVEIQCASSSMDSFKFSIQTNLSMISSREEMSALALATLSEIKADLESNDDVPPKEETTPVRTVIPPKLHHEPEMVPIEGNLTVLSQIDLGDGQVEITSDQVISPKKPITLSNFSLDFSDSYSDSNSNSTTDTSSDLGKCDFNSKGTEFTPKALTKQMKKVDHKKESTYGRLELINILEGNSDTEKKPKEFTHPPKKTTMVDDYCDFEEHIPSQIVCTKVFKNTTMEMEQDLMKELKEKEKSSKTSVKSTASKLLERLTTDSKARASSSRIGAVSDKPVLEGPGKSTPKSINAASTPKTTRYAKSKAAAGTSKPIILSEQIVKPATETSRSKSRKTMDDIEDVEAFVIHKDLKKTTFEEDETVKSKSVSTKSAGKAKILQQTIITPAGEIIQPIVSEAQPDDNIFDINSMPIVLSDDILTPESIEKMPIVIGSDTKPTVPEKVVKRPAPNRIITTATPPQTTPNKTITITKHKQPRILQSVSNRVVKNSPLLPTTAKPGKYIIVPQSSIPPTKYVSKKPAIVKKPPAPVVQKVPSIAPEPSGNKIMIVTNQQGQQQRLLLTPAQQKMLGYQNQKVTKTIVKSNVVQKSVLAAKNVPLAEAGTSGVVSKSPSLVGQKVLVSANAAQTLITTTSHQVIGSQGRATKATSRRSSTAAQKVTPAVSKPQKTILIKNQHGQTVRKIQGTDDELLDKQVAEQLEAIKASSGMKFSSQKPTDIAKSTPKVPTRRFYSKKGELKGRGPPPLAGLQQSPKTETVVTMPVAKKPEPPEVKPAPAVVEETKTAPTERQLNQLVIQDAVGNQTTITEGQILALPSETVDGQPQSYMLVTLDESGNLTPLNNEALMSLDPNLGLGGDLSNMVLQIDQSSFSSERPQTAIVKPPEAVEPAKPVNVEPVPQPVPEPSVTTEIAETAVEQKIPPATETVAASTNGDPGQQLIVTGDPIATQKFLESLSEGTTDLANILANAEGNSILIQADGQQILINTNTDNQMLLSMNNDSVNVTEHTEGGGNPIFATQPSKNQDILAAALADTDVFQQDHPSSTQSKIVSQLSPNNALYPMNVGNVLETSLTLSSPIMTPLEVPSTNSKKIPDEEADILTQVPKNVDLPITITDPNISQTVANQQVSAMIANELQTNLELALPISESTISTVSAEMNSPSYVYSLPTLDDSVEITQKPFNGSMPLLNEDIEETANKEKTDSDHKAGSEKPQRSKTEIGSEGFLAEEEGRFTLGGEMCSSLSEPPPEMFDLPEVNQNFSEKGGGNVRSLQSTPDVSDNASKDEDTTDLSHADTSNDGSCEIPLQPQIVAKSVDLSRSLDTLKRRLSEAEGENKKCKFD